MQVKEIEELTEEELRQKIDVLYPLCKWGEYVNTDEELFYQDQWDCLADELSERLGC